VYPLSETTGPPDTSGEPEITGLPDITGVILAGGEGIRLRSVVNDRPKVLAPICNRPFIFFLLDQFSRMQFREVVLCTGFKADVVKKCIGDRYGQLHISYSQESTPLGTGGALRLALPKIKSDIALVMNGDSFTRADLTAFYRWFQTMDPTCAIHLTKVNNTRRFGHVWISESGEITGFDEKGSQPGAGWINAGLYFFKTASIQSIPPGRFFSLEKGFFPELIGHGLYGFQSDVDFIDIGTPESYAKAEAFFCKRGLFHQHGT
jgi:NDP-sugar pyrophosphorylase family protein